VIAKNQNRCARIATEDLTNLGTDNRAHALNLRTEFTRSAPIEETDLGFPEVDLPWRLRLTAVRIEHCGGMRQRNVHEYNRRSPGLDRAGMNFCDTVELA
jgi:hypothetical protein